MPARSGAWALIRWKSTIVLSVGFTGSETGITRSSSRKPTLRITCVSDSSRETPNSQVSLDLLVVEARADSPSLSAKLQTALCTLVGTEVSDQSYFPHETCNR